MERKKITAPEGMMYTDGTTVGSTILLAVGEDESKFYLVTREAGLALMEEKEEVEE